MMLRYAAPLEGITGYVWRDAHRRVFGGADRYYAPFFSPDRNLRLQTKELRELGQGEPDLVPQVLTNRSDYFVWAARELSAMGYREVNLNLGCPSGTVVAKHKGSGMLRDPAETDRFLGEIFGALPDARISVKTRIGLRDTAEWPALLEVFGRYPIAALTVHPRLQSEQYGGAAHRELFLETMKETALPLVYNGDVTAPDDPAFGYGCGIMAGRGLLRNPALFRQSAGGAAPTRAELTGFHGLLTEGYAAYLPGETPLLHRMREFWAYFSAAFLLPPDMTKRMAKAKTWQEFRALTEEILRTAPLSGT